MHDAERNGNRTQTSLSQQIQWGISQNQGFSAGCNRQFDYLNRSVIVGGKIKKENTENMPAMNAKQFLSLPQLAKELIVSVAKMGQSTLSKYFEKKLSIIDRGISFLPNN